jgi:hypothetical protein
MTAQMFDVFPVVANPKKTNDAIAVKDSMTINALAQNFDMSRPAVSKHVKILSAPGSFPSKICREAFAP